MPLILPGNVASATAAAYEVANSCRFNDGDVAYMSRTLGTPTNADRYSFSLWMKRGSNFGSEQAIFVAGSSSSQGDLIMFRDDDKLEWQMYHGSTTAQYKTNREFRDPSAWMHLLFVYDSGNGTAGDRMRIYVNGVEETSFATETNVAQNTDSKINSAVLHGLGDDAGLDLIGAKHFDGYLAEVVLCDGQAYGPTDFGEFDSDSPRIWKPIDVSGLTFGDNGFYMDFEASGNLGNDANGGTDWAENNIVAADQATDTPTNNFCTLNPISAQPTNTPTLAEGNCRFSGTAAGEYGITGTMGVSSGKWYFEMKKVSQDSGPDDDSQRNVFGITAKPYGILAGKYSDPESWMLLGNSVISNNNVEIASVGASMLSDGGILQCALDLDNNRVAFGHDDAWQTGSSAFSGSYSDYESITAAASTISGFYFPVIGDNSGSRGYTMDANFGGCPAMTISSAAADENGYGTFEFAPPSGFLAMCTKNLAEEG
jgi:hypothetical protein